MTTPAPAAHERGRDLLDYGLLLLAYVVCSDEQIHSAEVEAVRLAGERMNVSEGTLIAVQAILADAEDKVPLETVLRHVPVSRREAVFVSVLEVAWADGVLLRSERALLERAAAEWSIPLSAIDAAAGRQPGARGPAEDAGQLPVEARFVGALNRLFGKDLVESAARLAPDNLAQRIERAQTTLLLSGPGYDEAVALCAQVATEDFQHAEDALVRTLADAGALRSRLDQVLVDLEDRRARDLPGHVRAVHDLLDGVRRSLDAEVAEEIRRLRSSLRARQRALGSFSIAFMGRTKAGKSTLHAVVTGEGWDAIGVGKQRTTRFNRVYEWRNVRVIDTPGIGAPGGRTDEDIARSVIDEADVVCYVVTDDSQQATEFSFLHVLRDHLKPLVILLNVKSNLRTPERLARFLRNPDKAFREEGTDGVRGHEQRIRRYAREHYGHDLFPILPVHLLSARMSREPEHAEHREALYRSSRLQDFLDHLRVSVLRDGPLRRSHTLLGSTARDLDHVETWLGHRADQIAHERGALEEKREMLRKALTRCARDARGHLSTELGTIWTHLEAEVTAWAEDHWNASTQDLQSAWAKHLEESGLDDRLRASVETSADTYRAEVASLLEEIGHDLRLSSVLGGRNVSLSGQDSTVYLKNALRFGGALVSLAGTVLAFSTPWGWGMVAAGTLATLLSGWFTSSAEKRRKAAENIRKALLADLDAHRNEVDSSARANLNQLIGNAERVCESYFGVLLDTMSLTERAFAECRDRVAEARTAIGRRYGARIVDWMEDRVCGDHVDPMASIVRRDRTSEGLTVVLSRPIRCVRDVTQVVAALQVPVRIDTPAKVHRTGKAP